LVPIERRAEHRLLHSVLGEVTATTYQDSVGQAVALIYGSPRKEWRPTLVRIQAACTYGALLAAECDCRHQINDTFRVFLDRGSGVLIYLNHAERTGGLVKRAQAYELADRAGVEQPREEYTRQHIDDDDYHYEVAGQILTDLEFHKVELLTTNQRKVDALLQHGLEVTTVRLTPHTQRRFSPPEARPTAPPCFVVGAAVMDHVYQLNGPPGSHGTRQSNRYHRRPGGKGLNQAIALARLGASASLLTVRGHDADGDEIAARLAHERVHAHYVRTPDGGVTTPQTAVLQTTNRVSTTVGWLGQEHRILRPAAIDERAEDIARSAAVLLTLEVSVEALDRTMQHTRHALVILNASPIAQSPYEVETAVIEKASVVIGSVDELTALLPSRRSRPTRNRIRNSGAAVAHELAEACRVPVVLTVLNGDSQTATAFIPGDVRPIVVRAPRVRMKAYEALGTSDVFCAAFALGSLRTSGVGSGAPVPKWRSPDSPLRERASMADILLFAIGTQAWVARSDGGLDNFPVEGDVFEEWTRDYPAKLTSEEDSPLA
jgi:sugar/nucleoside kinase (ribokinase family)/GTP cyclohydrolase II